MKTRHLLCTAAFVSLASACAVGPDFKTPEPPHVTRYTIGDPLPKATASTPVADGAAQKFSQDAALPANWWTLFGSPELNALVEQALKANPDVQAAKASLRQARETMYAAYGALLPSVDAGAGFEREKISGTQFGQPSLNIPPFTLYDATVSVSYGLDLFGLSRREIESLRAQKDAQRFELEASYLTLSGNVVTTAITEASLKEQVKETESLVKLEQELLDITQKQQVLGGASRTNVLQQQTALAQIQATLPPLQKQLAQQRHRLAILTGQLPAEQSIADFDIDKLHLPEDLPVSLPSKLTEQRPDIREAEALLHSASAQVGVATAEMFPQITLTAGTGTDATGFRSLFSGGTGVWDVGAALTQPIFHGGTLLHQKRAAVAAYDKAAAQYRSTVLTAFANVADSLRALQFDADALQAQASTESAASATLEMAQAQFKAGAISHLQLLTAENSLAQTRIALVQARAARLSDTVALFEALGGGWWNRSKQEQHVASAEKKQ